MKILYLTLTKPEDSLNWVYIKGLRQNNVVVDVFYKQKNKPGSLFQALLKYIKSSKEYDFVIIGQESSILAILCSLYSRKKIIFNAVLPVYDRLIISRNLAKPVSLKGIYYFLIDFFSFNLPRLIMLESSLQIEHCVNFYKVDPKKCFKAYIGVDDERFYYDSMIEKSKEFSVVFRGRFLPEAGVEVAVKAAKKLESEGIKFTIIGSGQELEKIKKIINELKPTNLNIITDFISINELRSIIQRSHLSLGQLSSHKRLDRTIPHKAYESIIMKIPYLTAENRGILDLLAPNETCLIFVPGDSDSLAEKIIWSRDNYYLTQKIAENAYQLYQHDLRADILAKKLLNKLASMLT